MAASIKIFRRYLSPLFFHKNLKIFPNKRIKEVTNGILSKRNTVANSQTPLFLCRAASSDSTSHTSFTRRTHLCGDLCAHHEGEKVRLCGWIQYHRSVFLILRDWSGLVQVKVPEGKMELVKSLRTESVLEVTGHVCLRPPGQENKSMPTGDVEIEVDDIHLLNSCSEDIPLEVKGYKSAIKQVNEFMRIKHRYLDMRFSQLQSTLRARSHFVMALRKFLADRHGFVEVETPTLFRRTPGGAREFIVPSHSFPGKFYSLPQSPQQFKQLLMAGGLDRYFQIARCYRDEALMADRQPEFTQVDLEMSFVDQDDVMSLTEEMVTQCWPRDKTIASTPFPRMTYHQAITKYGSDKPDIRFDWQVTEVTDLVRESCPPVFEACLDEPSGSVQALMVPEGTAHISNKVMDKIKTYVKSKKDCCSVKLFPIKVKEDGSWGSGLGQQLGGSARGAVEERLGAVPGDLIILATGLGFQPHQALGHVRCHSADALEAKGVPVRQDEFHFLWVDTFPLFEPKEDGGEGLASCHHPFTAPHPDDLDLVYTDPAQVRSLHYDLVLNGTEIGGGSIRIHDAALQRYILNTVLEEDSQELEHLLKALELGCPPHGGIALGLDRLVCIMLGQETIRDVIAFPKTGAGLDPLSQAPSPVSQDDLDYYSIACLEQPQTEDEGGEEDRPS